MTSALEFEEREDSGFLVGFSAALVASLVLHYGFYFWASGYEVKALSPTSFDELVPRKVLVSRLEIDPKLLEPEPEPSEQVLTKMAPEPVKLTGEEPLASEHEAVKVGPPEAIRLDEPIKGGEILPGMPGGESSFEDLISKGSARLSLPSTEEDKIEVEMEEKVGAPVESPVDSWRPGEGVMKSLPGGVEKRGALEGEGFSDLDKMLAQTGPLTPDTAPILLPGDLMFDYDSAELRPEAVNELKKLAELIRRSPDVVFVIEGHTDSFGSEEYNLGLSERRALAVKLWLEGELGISSERIRTVGMGEARLLVKGGTVEEQRLNRRVEIVIKQNFLK